MKGKKFFKSAISLVLLFSIITTFTACSEKAVEPLPDNMVEYADPDNGVSYSYNNSYVLSVDSPVDSKELRDYSEPAYNQTYQEKTKYSFTYKNCQYYIFKNEKNKLSEQSGNLLYTVDGKTLGKLKMSELDDEMYNSFVQSLQSQMEASSDSEVIADTSEKFVTYGENEFLHIKFSLTLGEEPYIYEQFLFQLEDGNVAKFALTSCESEYDFALSQTAKTLESLKFN